MTVVIPEVPEILLERYGGAIPRYTSYPTAVDWRDDVKPDDYPGLLKLAARHEGAASLYVHIPFCERRCLFCGCNVKVTRDRSLGDAYVDGIEKELMTLRNSGVGRRPLSQVHWGGGTPTWLTEAQTRRLHAGITDVFELEEGAEVAIEVDPRVTTEERVRLLGSLGFERISMGVQDLDVDVQHAIGRVQDEAATRALMDASRNAGFGSVNVDLILGLPAQTPESFAKTLEKIALWRPDRIAMFNYAHVPWLQKHHRAIDVSRAPTPEEKVTILRRSVAFLQDAGYVFLGLDHFALATDELAVAAEEQRLARNFMGYTVRGGEDLFAVGTSAIGEVSGAYVQAPRELDEWREAVEARSHAVVRGHRLVPDDRLRRSVIMELMCNSRVRKSAIEAEYGVVFDATFDVEIGALEALERDGLVYLEPHQISVTPLGRLFVRHVAAVFDRARRKESHRETRFSRTL